MVVKGGKRNEKETALLRPSGKRKKKQKGGKRRKKIQVKLVACIYD